MTYQLKAKLIKNIEVARNYYRMSLYSPRIARTAKPGQFIQVRVSLADEPLLRRPISIHRVVGMNIELLYQVVGKGTEALSLRKPGELVDIIGPLGNGFEYAIRSARNAVGILVAGGMGVAPLMFLAEELIKRRTRYAVRNTLVLIGARTKKQVLCEAEFKKLGCEVKVATDDGSKGFKGKVTDLLVDFLRRDTQYALRSTIYACGPKPMLKTVSAISRQKDISAQVSLEEHMACGIGACLGCAVKTNQGLKRVCKEGPVFNADELSW